jgi:hypothetical protein
MATKMTTEKIPMKYLKKLITKEFTHLIDLNWNTNTFYVSLSNCKKIFKYMIKELSVIISH